MDGDPLTLYSATELPDPLGLFRYTTYSNGLTAFGAVDGSGAGEACVSGTATAYDLSARMLSAGGAYCRITDTTKIFRDITPSDCVAADESILSAEDVFYALTDSGFDAITVWIVTNHS